MLDLYRFNQADLEDVKLADPAKYASLDEGEWVHPDGNVADTYNVFAAALGVNTDVKSNLAAMLFMEKGRTDARAVGKMTVVRGAYVRGRTDVFITAHAAQMTVGTPLTLAKDVDGRVKLDVAAPGDVIKAHVYKAPAMDAQGLLHFTLS